MRSLVIYESNYGNTKLIADAISKQIGAQSISIGDFRKDMLNDVELLVVGSPIIGWKPAEKTGAFLESLEKGSLIGKKAATFDTRVNVFFHGDAMGKISKKLSGAGASVLGSKAFFVKGKEGPLAEGELEKAEEWARTLLK